MADTDFPDIRRKIAITSSAGSLLIIVQAIACHAHVDVTMAIYAHTNLGAMRQTFDAIE